MRSEQESRWESCMPDTVITLRPNTLTCCPFLDHSYLTIEHEPLTTYDSLAFHSLRAQGT